jgi:hypothetical protein
VPGRGAGVKVVGVSSRVGYWVCLVMSVGTFCCFSGSADSVWVREVRTICSLDRTVALNSQFIVEQPNKNYCDYNIREIYGNPIRTWIKRQHEYTINFLRKQKNKVTNG